MCSVTAGICTQPGFLLLPIEIVILCHAQCPPRLLFDVTIDFVKQQTCGMGSGIPWVDRVLGNLNFRNYNCLPNILIKEMQQFASLEILNNSML